MKRLTKDEMKQVLGGSAPVDGSCCAHNADWSYQSCGVDQATAQSRADQYAEGSGQHGYWCCDSCNPPL